MMTEPRLYNFIRFTSTAKYVVAKKKNRRSSGIIYLDIIVLANIYIYIYIQPLSSTHFVAW
jgi:hypothetical protein